MFLFGRLATWMALLAVIIPTAVGATLGFPVEQVLREDDELSCHTIDRYTTQWFLNNVRPQFTMNLSRNALFYSRGMSGSARALARTKGLITIWDIWPCYLYVHHNTPNNPMRCIHHNEKQRTLFYENMSRAFAVKASKSALVMHSLQDFDSPPLTGIWGRIEFPTLQNVTDVDWIAKLNQDASSLKVFWKRLRDSMSHGISLLNPRPPPDARLDLRKRAVAACMPPQDYSFFDDVDW